MKIFLSLLFFFQVVYCFSQTNKKLISRHLFITGEQRFYFKLSPKGDAVYFQTNVTNSLNYCFTSTPTVLHTVTIPFIAFTWEVFSDGLLVASGDSLPKLAMIFNDGTQKIINLSFPVKKIRIMMPAVDNVFALDVTAADTSQSGIYSFNLTTAFFNKIAASQPGKTIFFTRQ